MDGEFSEREAVEETESAWDALRVKWTGTTPILMHNERLANPSDPIVKKMKELTSLTTKQKNTDAIQEQLRRLEWEGGLYMSEEHGPIIPAFNIRSCIRDGGRMSKLGKDIERGVLIMGDAKLGYSGPRALDAMWEAGLSDTRGVKLNGRTKVQRTRPMFPTGWTLDFQLRFNPEVIDRATLLQVMKDTGLAVGLGDFKARFGRFSVEVIG